MPGFLVGAVPHDKEPAVHDDTRVIIDQLLHLLDNVRALEEPLGDSMRVRVVTRHPDQPISAIRRDEEAPVPVIDPARPRLSALQPSHFESLRDHPVVRIPQFFQKPVLERESVYVKAGCEMVQLAHGCETDRMRKQSEIDSKA